MTLQHLQSALRARHVFATRSPTLALLVVAEKKLMGARLHLTSTEPLRVDVWCHDSLVSQGRARLELWSNGAKLIATHEPRGLQHVGWSATIAPRDAGEHWFVVRVSYDGMARAYSSPLWARWSSPL